MNLHTILENSVFQKNFTYHAVFQKLLTSPRKIYLVDIHILSLHNQNTMSKGLYFERKIEIGP